MKPLYILIVICAIRVYLFNIGSTFGSNLFKPIASTSAAITVSTLFNTLTESIRNRSVELSHQYLPSPHSELLLGMTLGIDGLKQVPRFNEALKNTGTVHVVVVSGFNISLVFSMVLRLIGSQYKFKNLMIAQIIVLFYALLTGFQPPVVRSLIMGSIAGWGKYYGRTIDTFRILLFSGVILVLIDPQYLTSLSFQLSFMATLSLILFSEPIQYVLSKILTFTKNLNETCKVFFGDFCTSIAAQILVWPLISVTFGRVSLLSPFINALILWTVSIATILGGLFLLSGFIFSSLAFLAALIIYPFLDIFAVVVYQASTIPFMSVDFKLSIWSAVIYYVVVGLSYIIIIKKFQRSALLGDNNSLS